MVGGAEKMAERNSFWRKPGHRSSFGKQLYACLLASCCTWDRNTLKIGGRGGGRHLMNDSCDGQLQNLLASQKDTLVRKYINCVPLSLPERSLSSLLTLPWTRCTSSCRTSSHNLGRRRETRWCRSSRLTWKCRAGYTCTSQSRWRPRWSGTSRQTPRWRCKRRGHSVRLWWSSWPPLCWLEEDQHWVGFRFRGFL